MKKINLLRIASGISSVICLIIILFCPLIGFGDWGKYTYFSILGKRGSDEITVQISISITVVVTLITVLVALFGSSKKTKIATAILNIIGIIPVLYLIIWLISNNDGDLIGIAIYLYILFAVIALILICISDNTFNSKNSNNISNADNLIKYKQLLDSGAITKEEYDNLKAHILNS